MEIKSDIICKGAAWYKVGKGYGYNENPKFFDTFWASFKLCMAIGILYDRQLDDESDYEEEEKMTLPRTMFNRHGEEMKFFFQSAILTSNCIDLSEKDRLFLAFSEDVSEDELEEIEAIKNNGEYHYQKVSSHIDDEDMQNIRETFETIKEKAQKRKNGGLSR